MSVQTGARFLLGSTGLVAFCLCSDHIVYGWEDKWKALPQGVAARAAVDNLVHGVVGGWTWANAVVLLGGQLTSTVRVLQVACCVAMASVIDLDHFIAARSIAVKVSAIYREDDSVVFVVAIGPAGSL